MLLAVACLSHAPYVFGETRSPGSGVMPPKELELLIIAVGVEIRAGRIQANADQLDKPARQTPRGLRVVFIFTHVAQPASGAFAQWRHSRPTHYEFGFGILDPV